ncbi:hypothetical protein RJ639_033310 [Escallonia herrerae]|uniref:Uncharacterized protein n=1 Tax=Escallonia herrerae TaxID=1293975 RepID=A0AA88X8J4_9ASTE|nr:hypothetical protein RJ639_033310 [Escallonia herrerae]
MKDQIKGLQLDENEEICLRKLIMGCKNDKPEEWNKSGFPSSDNVRRAQLQAIIRSIYWQFCHFPLNSFMRNDCKALSVPCRFKNLAKVLYVEAIQTGILSETDGESSISRHGVKGLPGRGKKKEEYATGGGSEHKANDNGNIL